MKLRALFEGLAVLATLKTADVAKDALVAITDDGEVDAAGAGDFVVGRLFKSAKEAGGSCTVETRCKELIEIKATGAITAGQFVGMAADDPSGTQTVAPESFDPETTIGVCWKGGADNTTVEVLLF